MGTGRLSVRGPLHLSVRGPSGPASGSVRAGRTPGAVDNRRHLLYDAPTRQVDPRGASATAVGGWRAFGSLVHRAARALRHGVASLRRRSRQKPDDGPDDEDGRRPSGADDRSRRFKIMNMEHFLEWGGECACANLARRRSALDESPAAERCFDSLPAAAGLRPFWHTPCGGSPYCWRADQALPKTAGGRPASRERRRPPAEHTSEGIQRMNRRLVSTFSVILLPRRRRHGLWPDADGQSLRHGDGRLGSRAPRRHGHRQRHRCAAHAVHRRPGSVAIPRPGSRRLHR